MDRRLPGTTAPVAAPLADGVGQLASAGGSFVGSALAAGVDQALRTGDDNALFAAVANMTAGLADVPARSTVAANPSPAEGAASAGQPVIGNCQTALSQAGEGLKLSPSPVGDTDAETLTMEDHLSLHPGDAVCPNCDGNGTDGQGGSNNPCPRCLGDRRRGFDCPECKGAGGWTTRVGAITYADGSQDWDSEWEECDAPGCRCGRLAVVADGEDRTDA